MSAYLPQNALIMALAFLGTTLVVLACVLAFLSDC
jgi:hypothetical protein